MSAADGGSSFPPTTGPPAANSNDYFNEQFFDTTWKSTWEYWARPSNAIDQRSLSFHLDKLDGSHYMFLQDLKLKLSVQLVSKDGRVPDDNMRVAPCSNFPAAMIRSTRVLLNETLVGVPNDGFYPYTHSVSSMLSSSTDKRNGFNSLLGEYQDHNTDLETSKSDTAYSMRRSLFGDIHLKLNRDAETTTKIGTLDEAIASLEAKKVEAESQVEQAQLARVQINAKVNATDDEKAAAESSFESKKSALQKIENRLNQKTAERKKLYNDSDQFDKIFKYSDRVLDFYTFLQTDFTSCPLPLMPGVGVRVDIQINRPGFYIQCAANELDACKEQQYYLRIVRAELSVPVREMNDSLHMEMEQKLLKSPAVFPLTRSATKSTAIPQGLRTWTSGQIKQGSTTPDRIIFFIIPSHIVDDDYGHSAFYMPQKIMAKANAKDIEEMVLESDILTIFKLDTAACLENVRLIQGTRDLDGAETTAGADSLARKKMFDLYTAMGRSNDTFAPLITLEQFRANKFIMLYDMTKSKRAAFLSEVRQMPAEGPLTFHLAFDKELPCPAYLYTMAEHHSEVKIDKNRNVTYAQQT